MSFIRPGSSPQWVDDAETEGLYVYSSGDWLHGMPPTEKEFVEVVMRMLDQSDELTDEELDDVFTAFAVRLNWEETEPTRNVTQSDAAWGVLDGYTFCKENGYTEMADELESIWETLEHDDL